MRPRRPALLLAALLPPCAPAPTEAAPPPVTITGELKQWHKVTLTVDGPYARERATDPNPFLDYRLTVRFAHESGDPVYEVPGHFAADGRAGETSAEDGRKWRAHLSPDKPGRWTWRVSMVQGPRVAVDPTAKGDPVAGVDGIAGVVDFLPTDKTGRDFRAHGRLRYEGGHYLRFARTGERFLKAGADAPETLLAYADFDGTTATKKEGPLKTWSPHRRDFRPGDPTWKGGKGKGLIGALNYLASRGANAFSFLTYNAGGDGDNVWPFVERNDRLHYDCSKLDQWQVVFEHAQSLGLFLHFKTQETENDDERLTHERTPGRVPEALDGGAVGIERRLYYRELVARFGHLLALNWNLGEENTQTPEEQRAMAAALHQLDPYGHLVVIHTHPGDQDLVYTPLLGPGSALTGASLQNPWDVAHQRVLRWRRESAKAGRPWVVANDEQGDAALGVPPDPGFEGFSGKAKEKSGREYDLHDIRRHTLWGTLLAGGAGVEYYFGYSLPQNDLLGEDWRSRERSWDYAAVALRFFERERIPFWEMEPADALVGNVAEDNSRYAFAKRGELYLVYLPRGGTGELDLSATSGSFTVAWLDPRKGGPLQGGSVREVMGGARVSLGAPPAPPDTDWLAVVRRRPPNVVLVLADHGAARHPRLRRVDPLCHPRRADSAVARPPSSAIPPFPAPGRASRITGLIPEHARAGGSTSSRSAGRSGPTGTRISRPGIDASAGTRGWYVDSISFQAGSPCRGLLHPCPPPPARHPPGRPVGGRDRVRHELCPGGAVPLFSNINSSAGQALRGRSTWPSTRAGTSSRRAARRRDAELGGTQLLEAALDQAEQQGLPPREPDPNAPRRRGGSRARRPRSPRTDARVTQKEGAAMDRQPSSPRATRSLGSALVLGTLS